jgi:hypothetical protein
MYLLILKQDVPRISRSRAITRTSFLCLRWATYEQNVPRMRCRFAGMRRFSHDHGDLFSLALLRAPLIIRGVHMCSSAWGVVTASAVPRSSNAKYVILLLLVNSRRSVKAIRREST